MKKFRTAIRFNELTEAEKNRINDALDEARERAGVKKLTREQILEVTETVKGFILRERQRIKEAKKKKGQSSGDQENEGQNKNGKKKSNKQ